MKSEIKQSKFALEESRLELDSLHKKLEDSETYLKAEAMKTKKVSDELLIYKEKVNMLERRLRNQSTSGANSGAASPRTNVSMSTTVQDTSMTSQQSAYPPKTGSGGLNSHNPLKSSGHNIGRAGFTGGPETPLLRKTSSSQPEPPIQDSVDPSPGTQSKKTGANMQKLLEALEAEKSELERKLMACSSSLARKEAECSELRRCFEEKAEQASHLQEEVRKLTVSTKSLNEKRLLGLKEIQKLRDKLETTKAQNALNESLNSSFSMSMNGSFDLSQRDKAKLADLLKM